MTQVISAYAGSLKIEIDRRDAVDMIETVNEAFKEAGMDIPKHLGDALLSLENQIAEYDGL